MIKRWLSILLVSLMLMPCARALSFTDALGRRVELDAPRRVASLYNSYGDAWMTAGGQLAGSIADSSGEPLPEQGPVLLGSHISPNLELLFSLEPDFVLLSADVSSHARIGVQLEEAGVPCAFFSTPDYRSYMEMMELFCRLNGREELFQSQVETVQEPIEAMLAEAQALPGEAPTALLIRAHSTAVKCRNSEGTVAGCILRDMGFVNLADGNSALCEGIGMEAILMEDPDYIFVILQGSSPEAAQGNLAVLTGNPAWSGLTAVREDRFIVLDRELFHYHPNERWAEAYAFILDLRKGER